MEEIDKLPGQFQNLVRVLGLEAATRLCREYGGEVLYIPKLDRIEAAKQRELIRAEWTGYNSLELARKYGKSVRWVQKIVEEVPVPEIPGQVSIQDIFKEL